MTESWSSYKYEVTIPFASLYKEAEKIGGQRKVTKPKKLNEGVIKSGYTQKVSDNDRVPGYYPGTVYFSLS